MDKELLEFKQAIRDKLKMDFIIPEDIPNMELYMEQLTRFMDQKLKDNLRSDEDKVLTKAMINNYTKNKILPPPVKKKYNRTHLIMLIYIFYMKNVMSIGEIQKLVEPMMNGKIDDNALYEIYEKTFEMEKPQYFNIEASVAKAAQITEKKIPKEDDEYLNKMMFIFLLGYDIFCKKRLIEKLIDELD